MKIISLTFILFIISCKLFAQSAKEKFENALMEEKGGAKVIYTSDAHSFTFDVISNNIEPLQAGYLSVDSKILQYIFIGNDALQENDGNEKQQKAQLLAYMQYELDYIKGDLKLNYTGLVHEWLMLNNKLFLSWYYDMPENKKAKKGTVVKQCNLSTLCFAHVLNLNTPFEKDDNLDVDKELLAKVAQTLKLNDFKIDFGDMYKQLEEGLKK